MSNTTLKMKNETPLVTVPSKSLGMKALRKILLALTAVAALSVAHPAKANLITNPGFETGSMGWTLFPGAGVSGAQSGVSPHSGNAQLFTATSVQGAGVGQLLATTPGATYTVSFFLAAAETGGSLNVLWGGSTVFSHVFTSLSGYTEYTFNVTASNASTALRFSFRGRNQFLDDISVEPAGVGVPDGGSTVSLLGCALLGVAVLRRKLRC